MMRTDIVVKAHSEKAKSVLLRNKDEEEALKKKYGSVFGVLKLKRLPSNEQKVITARLLTQHAFYDAKEDNKFCHRIIGRSVLGERDKNNIFNTISDEMLADGCTIDDFEVLFYDEQ